MKEMKKASRKLLAVLLSFFMVVSMLPVTGMKTEAAGKLGLARKSVSVTIGGTANIKVKNAARGAKITYKSSRKKVASVSKKGKVKGIKSGTAKITVSVKQKGKTTKLTCKVTVKKPKLSKNNVSLAPGKTLKLSVKNKPKKAKYTWKSGNPKVAAVNKTGKITAKAEGKTVIRVTVKTSKKTYKLSCNVNVAYADCTVTFNSTGGSGVESQTVKRNTTVKQPSDPVRSGYVFDGWYTEANGGKKFDFNTVILADITLYAHWTRSGGTYRIAFDQNDGSAGLYQVQTLQAGAVVQKPSDPSRNLYRFTGWYTDSAATEKYDFSSPVVSDLTLYAGWGNPDGSDDELYAATDKTETIYSISGIEVTGNTVNVTYNANSKCLMAVEFFEDHMSDSDWSESAQKENLSETPIATAEEYTEDYAELQTLSLPIEGNLPEHYVVRATLFGSGEENDPTYVCNQYTATYEEFEEQTVDSAIEQYGEEDVINFDNDRTTNFGVLKDSVKVIDMENLMSNFEVTDVDVEGELVPDHNFVFTNADDQIQSLQEGDVVYLKGTTWLFKIATISNDQGTITLTQDKEATMKDFYDVLQVDLESKTSESVDTQSSAFMLGEDAGIAPQIDLIDLDASLSGSFGANIKREFENGVSVTGSLTGKITGKVTMSYDAHLFSKNYFECSYSFTTEISAKVEVSLSTDNTNEWKNVENVAYQFDTRKIKLPTPVTGLDVYAKPAAKIDWKISGSASIEMSTKQITGSSYNSDTGRTDTKKKESKVSLMAQGEAEMKIGPNIDIGVEFLGGVLSAGVTAEAGAKATATVQTGDNDRTDTIDSKHACRLCVSGKAEWYATASVKCSYKISEKWSGDIANATILDFSSPIYFKPGVKGEFFVSLINEKDSKFKGAVKFGGGSCTNKTYHTEIRVLDENGQQINGAGVSVVKQGSQNAVSGNSPKVCYLYEGTYDAAANIKGKKVSKKFTVTDQRQTVNLTANSSDNMLEGTVVDGSHNDAALSGAVIKVSKDGVVIGSVESDANGTFQIAVPDGSVDVEISKDGYLPFDSRETIYDGEHHSMGLIKMTAGSGMGGFRGVIRDATNNNPLSGVTLNLYKGWNSAQEANTALLTLTTNSSGEFRCNAWRVFGKVVGLPCGNYTLSASKEGYTDVSYNIVIYPGTTDENPEISETMSPFMNEDEYRIVLTWGETPEDLDSHLVADTDVDSSMHVYYSDDSPYPYYANLDYDETESYGPETITITDFGKLKNIRYAVHDYTNRYESSSDALSYSGATVRLFKGNQLIRTFKVPSGYGGTEWDVFSIDSNGRITTVNTMKYTEEPEDVLYF